MWQKILTAENALTLKPGSFVVKYGGEAEDIPDTVDFSNDEFILYYNGPNL